MASADQLKALLRSHVEGDDRRFFSVVMQVAAREAKRGHIKVAQELRALVDEAKRQRSVGRPVPISRPRGELADLLIVSYPQLRLADMVLSESVARQIQRVIREHRQAGCILAHGLSLRRKLLLVGPPGTGKTMTASVLAAELGIPLFQVRLDALITKFLGETAARLRQVFEAADQARGVYFFDEFDAIGSQRGLSNDVGEIRRVLNSFLQMIEQDRSNSLIVAATNHAEILDRALFRRFDDVLHYTLPDPFRIEELLKAKLLPMADKDVSWDHLAEEAKGMNYAEIARAAEEALKSAVLDGRERVPQGDILAALQERRRVMEV